MRYLVDTCVISELIKPTPNQDVVTALRDIHREDSFLSVLTIGELEKGIAKLPESKKKNRLDDWLNQDLLKQFDGRLLPLDLASARQWGVLQGSQAKGVVLPAVDGMIAATAIVHQLTVITRNVKDMTRCGATVMNPW